jgi:hypothetical protein
MDTVKSLRPAFAALALVVALVGVSTVPAYAGPAREGCAPAVKGAHDCCKTPVLKACCSDRSDASRQGAPAESKVQVNPNLTAAPAIFVVDLASNVRPIVRPQSTPLRAGPLDLPTLLSTLLI